MQSFDPKNEVEHGKAAAEAAFRIDAYIRRTFLQKFEHDGDLFDPLLVGLLRRDVAPELEALDKLADLTQQAGLLWTQSKLKMAYGALDHLGNPA